MRPTRLAPWLAVALLPLHVLCLPSETAQGQDSPWKVGLAHVKITPTEPVFLAGYSSRNKPFTGVESDLYAKALALEDSQGFRAVLITSDLIGFRGSIAEPICERIMAQTGLKRSQILINSSHTHTGPTLSLEASPRDLFTAADAQRTVEYTRSVQDKVTDLAVRALADMTPARLAWGVGVVHFPMNRRQFTPQGVILGANPRGLADRTVPVLRIDAPDGKLRAVLFGAAVHNTTLRPKHYEICGDYAGFAQEYLQQQYPEVQAMFMLGCAGDADPYPFGSMELARQHGQTLGTEVSRILKGELRPIRGPLRIAFDRVDLPLQQLERSELEELARPERGVLPGVARQMLAVLDRGQALPRHYNCPATVWQFGQDLTLVGLSGEVVVDYVTMIEHALGPQPLWLAAYCNDVFGYLPSARLLDEGGYETRGIFAGGPGLFDHTAQDVLVAKIRELAAQVRATPK
ncbi:MAG: neutral/alkaline non-lysosomal ceramidase N-terminal domain-containing protein [Pirellulaceae bacterium]